MEPAEAHELAAAVRRDAAVLAEVARRAPGADVPACPGWDMTQLLNHLGRVHRWAAAAVESQAAEPLPFPPRPDEVTVEWFAEGADHLADVLERAADDPTAPAWNFLGVVPPDASFWIRRQAIETAIHRWDAEGATGTPAPIDVAVALAGIEEALTLHAPRAAAAGLDAATGLGGSLHFHTTDSDRGEWIVRFDGGRLSVERGHAKGDAAARGTASDLLLFLWGRADTAALEVFGDAAVLDRWRQGVTLG